MPCSNSTRSGAGRSPAIAVESSLHGRMASLRCQVERPPDRNARRRCYSCLRNDVSPMSPEWTASEVGRDDWIRTSDPLNPIQVRYQTALRPDSAWVRELPAPARACGLALRRASASRPRGCGLACRGGPCRCDRLRVRPPSCRAAGSASPAGPAARREPSRSAAACSAESAAPLGRRLVVERQLIAASSLLLDLPPRTRRERSGLRRRPAA